MRRIVVASALALSLLSALAAEAEGDLFVTVTPADFRGGQLTSFLVEEFASAYCDNLCEMVASAPLPNGATVLGIEIDACRDSEGAAPLSYQLIRRYPNHGEVDDSKFEVLVQGTVAGPVTTPCGYHLAVAQPTPEINWFAGEYLVLVVVGDPGCVTCPSLTTRFQAVRLYYLANAHGGPVEPTKPTGSATLFP